MEHPFSQTSGLLLAQVHATARGKEAFLDLREEAEMHIGRLTQPEAFELIVAFAVEHQGLFARWLAQAADPAS